MALTPSMAALNSMRLLVVFGAPPHNSCSSPSGSCTYTPHPPKPGLPRQAPSTYKVIGLIMIGFGSKAISDECSLPKPCVCVKTQMALIAE